MAQGKSTDFDGKAEIKAYLEIMMMLSLTNGVVKDSDIENLGITIARDAKLQDLGGKQIINTLFQAWEDLKIQGVDYRIVEIAKVLKEKDQQIDAMGMAIAIAAFDGKIGTQQRCILEKLQRALNLTEDNIEEAIRRYGNIPLLIFITRNSLNGSSDVLSTLWQQGFGNNRLRTQELTSYLLYLIEEGHIPIRRESRMPMSLSLN